MPKSTVSFTPRGHGGMLVTLRTDKGWELTAEGELVGAPPVLSGRQALQDNLVVTTNLWAYAVQEKQRRRTQHAERKAAFAKQAELHGELACDVADLVDRLGDEGRDGWCSGCFSKVHHRKVDGGGTPATYLCDECGAATHVCAAPKCQSMATRGFGKIRLPRYCAEHRHDIPAFDRGAERIADLTEYQSLLEYAKPNLARITKLGASALVAAGAMTGVGLFAAPLVGGAIGTMVGGYSGAAATSYGLALLGGGAVGSSTFAFGMAGGTAVIAAVGGGLGGVMGMGLTNAYIREDRSFSIEQLQHGDGVPVIVCSGFLTEGASGWGNWERPVTQRYPDSPVYRVHWGAQDLAALSAVLGGGSARYVAGQVLRKGAMRASKQTAMRASPLTGGLIAVDLVKNPWLRARQRANKTGAIVADLLARTDIDQVVLIGHSLGARAMICAAEALGSKESAARVREMHLLGAAIGAKGPWHQLANAVDGKAYNYHSRNDKTLRFFYTGAQGGQKAAGFAGMETKQASIANLDVTSQVPGHSDYAKRLDLR